MQLKFELEDGYVSVLTEGKITQNGQGSKLDPVTESLGISVFSRPILINLSGSDYIDSCGVGWLLLCHKRCREAGGMMVLHSMPPMIKQILRVLHMDAVFNIAEDAAAAKAMIQIPEVLDDQQRSD